MDENFYDYHDAVIEVGDHVYCHLTADKAARFRGIVVELDRYEHRVKVRGDEGSGDWAGKLWGTSRSENLIVDRKFYSGVEVVEVKQEEIKPGTGPENPDAVWKAHKDFFNNM